MQIVPLKDHVVHLYQIPSAMRLPDVTNQRFFYLSRRMLRLDAVPAPYNRGLAP